MTERQALTERVLTERVLTEKVEACYRALDFDGLAEIYADDVILDAHVPGWRFQIQGAKAVAGWFNDTVEGFGDLRTTWARATPTDDGVVVEWEMRHGDPDDESLCRQVDILHGDGERITDHVFWCTGMWDPATIARHRAEAPVIRW